MPAPSDSFVLDFVRKEGGISTAALELALARKTKPSRGAPLPLGLDLLASGALSLERYLKLLRAHEGRSAPCPACAALRYVKRESTKEVPCPACGEKAAPSPPADVREKEIGKDLSFEDYVLEGALGRGGMGVVFRAFYRPLGRHEALKILLPREESRDRIARFHRERALLARVSHPAVVTVHRAGEHGGLEFLSMELVPGGRTLRSLMDAHEGGIPVELACRIVVEAARGVGAAHEAGILHRDLKPENVLLDEKDSAHVADFGLARALEGEESLTRTGSILGTPLYMSLEQLEGKGDLDARADVYALSTLLYELLAGDHPHAGATTIVALVERVRRNAAPPLREVRSDAPPALESLLALGMSPRREDRPATGRELARAIEEALRFPGSRKLDRLGLRSRSTPRVLALVLVALALAGLLGWLATKGPSASELERQRLSWTGARLEAARAAQEAVSRAETIAREEGRGATVELDQAASVFETALASIGPPPAGMVLPPQEPELAHAQVALAMARARAANLNAKDGASLEAVLALLDRLVGKDDLPIERAELLLDLGRTKEAIEQCERASSKGVLPGGNAGQRSALVLARARLKESVPVETPDALASRAAHRATLEERRAFADALLSLGFPDLAASELEDAAAADARDPLESGLAKAAQGAALVASGRSAQADAVLRASLALLERPLPGVHPLTRRRIARAGRARALVAQGDAFRLAQQDKDGARIRYEAAAKADPSDSVPHVRLAELALESGDAARARSRAEAALAAAPGSPAALSAFAEACIVLHETERARRRLESISVELLPESVRRSDLWLGLARMELQPQPGLLPDPGKGTRLLDQAAALDQGDAIVRQVRAETAVARWRGEPRRAQAARARGEARLLERPRSAALLGSLAEACMAQSDDRAGLDLANLAVAANPRCGEARLALANAYAKVSKRYDEAIDEFRFALDHGAPPQEAGLNLGITLAARERPSEALPAFDAAIRWEPFSAPIYGARAATWKKVGRVEESDLDRDRQSSFLTPPDAAWKEAFGRARALEATDRAGAARIYDDLTRTRPGQGEAIFRRALLDLALGPSPLGVAMLARAVSAEPGLEHAFAIEIRRIARENPDAIAALGSGVDGRPDLEGEAAYARGVLALQNAATARGEDASHAARALLCLEQAVSARPLFHAARLARGLAKSLLVPGAAGARDARDALSFWPGMRGASRAILAVILARSGDDAAAEEALGKALQEDPDAKFRPELKLLPRAFRSREWARKNLGDE